MEDIKSEAIDGSQEKMKEIAEAMEQRLKDRKEEIRRLKEERKQKMREYIEDKEEKEGPQAQIPEVDETIEITLQETEVKTLEDLQLTFASAKFRCLVIKQKLRKLQTVLKCIFTLYVKSSDDSEDTDKEIFQAEQEMDVDVKDIVKNLKSAIRLLRTENITKKW